MKVATVDVASDGLTATIGIMFSDENSNPEEIGETIRMLTNSGVSVDFTEGTAVLGPYTSGTESRRAVLDEWIAS